ncbi:MAG TPA: hypothetical protein VEC37_19200 [Bacillota bacterium]|nr:hypothetical protein [Bacillota bacterium]
MSVEKAAKSLERHKGDTCFLIGSFTILHKEDLTIADPKILDGNRVINSDCQFYSYIKMINLENGKTYNIVLKPITGSITGYSYGAKQLEKNTANPYWVLEVPPGVYKLATMFCDYKINKPGYLEYSAVLFGALLPSLIHQEITIDAKPNQMIYLGDFRATLLTYIIADSENRLYPFCKFQLEFANHFDAAKTALVNGLNDKSQARLDQMEFVSVLH